MKQDRAQGNAYEMIDIPPSGPVAPASQEEVCETPSATSQPLPTIPIPTSDKENKEEDVVYDAIAEDN